MALLNVYTKSSRNENRTTVNTRMYYLNEFAGRCYRGKTFEFETVFPANITQKCTANGTDVEATSSDRA